MKKILTILFSIIMILALVGCKKNKKPVGSGGNSENNGTENNGGTGNGGGNTVVKPGDDYDPYDPEQYIYKSVFANSPYKDQWDTSKSGATLDHIWDSSVLPETFPKKPSSIIEVDHTGYVGKYDYKYGSYPPGRLYYEYEKNDEKYWEYYTVLCTGTKETLDSLIEDMSDNFECYDERDDGIGETRFGGELHAYSKNLYIFIQYYENGSYNLDTFEFEGDGTVTYTLYAMPALHQLPKIVEGIPLLQVGYMMYPLDYITCYNDGDDDYTFIDYDFKTGKADGTLKENWTTEEISYYGAKMTDIENYQTQLINAGFSLQFGDYNYWWYTKGDINLVIQYDTDYKCASVTVLVGNWG